MRETLPRQESARLWIMSGRMTSRREEKERRRAERMAAEQTAAEQAKRRRTYSIIVGSVLALAAVAAVVVVAAAGGGNGGDGDSMTATLVGEESFSNASDPPPASGESLFAAARAARCTLRNPPIEGRNHVPPEEKVEYNTTPATAGNHDAVPTGDGVFAREPSIRNLVHTMEHGRVLIHYSPDLPQADLRKLGGLFNEDPYHMVLTPNREMRYRVAATAWGHLLACDKLTDDAFAALRAFRDRYRDQGPEQVP